MTCECGVCTKIKRWRAALQIDTPEKEAAFGEMIGEWEALERVRANAERTSSI
jgi:hypothetical protein